MSPEQLTEQIRAKKSMLCVGLDTDPDLLPACLNNDPDKVVTFNREIINATQEFAVAYKVNIAFYESMGVKGWQALEKTVAALPQNCLLIADAKRGDIGNTSRHYAKTFFEVYPFDAITVAPYMGADSVEPFLDYPDKWVFLLALTSNPGSSDFQWHGSESQPLFERVVSRSLDWKAKGNLGFVVGATRGETIGKVRELAPRSFFLVPGIGAQGGDLATVCQYGLAPNVGLLINASRSIIYASKNSDFAQAAQREAQKLSQETAAYL